MPYFAILPMWAFFLLLALIFFFVSSLRFLSLYLISCSTCGLILSIIFPFCDLMIAQLLTFDKHPGLQMFGVALLFLSIPFGFVIGAGAGFFLARSANRKLGWQKNP